MAMPTTPVATQIQPIGKASVVDPQSIAPVTASTANDSTPINRSTATEATASLASSVRRDRV